MEMPASPNNEAKLDATSDKYILMPSEAKGDILRCV
jgi:hypothetical protein